MIDSNIFREYDIRGIFGKNLNSTLMESIGIELRKMFPKDSFIVGNDIRKSGKELSGALIKGLKNNVIYSGTTSFGETLFAGLKLKKNKTLFITASHSAPNWNGLKLYNGDGDPISSKIIYKLRDNVVKNISKIEKEKNYLIYLSRVENINFNKKYLEFMKSTFKIKPFKVVLDCSNGATCLTAPKIFKDFKLKNIFLNTKINANFPGHGPDIKIEKLIELHSKVLSEKASMGVAFDGDGDRFILVDEKGKFHRSDKIGLMLAKNMLKNSNKKTVVISAPVSMAVEKELTKLKAKIIRVPVGHTHILSTAKKNNALIGMEESGHLVLTDYFYFDDALIPVLKTLEIMSKKNKKLSELLQELPEYPFLEIEINCEDNIKFKFIEKMTKKFSKKYDISTLDGLKINLKDGWILIRASNTGPQLRLYIEATSKKRLNDLKKKFYTLFSKELKKL